MRGLILAVLLLAARPATKPVTILDVFKGSDSGLVVGGWDGSKWVHDKAWHAHIRGGEQYRFYAADGPGAQASGRKAVLSEASGASWVVNLSRAPSSSAECIGLTGTWNAVPRGAGALDPSSAVFKAAASGVLRMKGLSGAAVKVTQAVSVDLDGDGTEEALISASSPRLLDKSGEALTSAHSTDYSFVLLRHQSGGRFVTDLLAGQFKPGKNDTAQVYEIGTPLDLNGDGKMEIVVHWRYYEGGGVQVFELKGGRPRLALSASDGA
jgi:hypothetical protein